MQAIQLLCVIGTVLPSDSSDDETFFRLEVILNIVTEMCLMSMSIVMVTPTSMHAATGRLTSIWLFRPSASFFSVSISPMATADRGCYRRRKKLAD